MTSLKPIPAGRVAASLIAALAREATRSLRRGVQETVERWRLHRTRRDRVTVLRSLASARRILFVCHGNIIRSAFAAQVVSDALAESGVSIESAGLEAVTGDPAHALAMSTARKRGIDLGGHVSSGITQRAVEAADVVFVMTIDQLVTLRRRFPAAAPKIFLLTCLAPDRPLDIPDPVDDPLVFEDCFSDIIGAVQPIAAALQSRSGRLDSRPRGSTGGIPSARRPDPARVEAGH